MPDTQDPQIRELLAEALSDQPPPPTIDRDTLIARGRRARRRRHVLATCGSLAAVALLGGAVVGAGQLLPGPPGPDPQLQPAGSGPGASASASPSSQPPLSLRGAARLTGALRTDLDRFLPGARYSVQVGQGALRDMPPLTFVKRQHTWYQAGATVHTSAGVGTVLVGVIPDSVPGLTAPGGSGSSSGRTLRHLNGRTYRLHTVDYGTGAVRYVATATHSDGTQVYVISDNVRPLDPEERRDPPKPQPGAPKPVLTAKQAATIALDPDLHP